MILYIFVIWVVIVLILATDRFGSRLSYLGKKES